MADVELRPLPPLQAMAYFEGKGYRTSFAWQDVWQEEHARAFTVAKAMDRDILEDIRGAMQEAIDNGETFETFRSKLQPVLEAKGWWGRKPMTDPVTGEERDVQLGSGRRLRTIYNTNMRTAHAAGRWERIQGVKDAFPYLRYVAVMDSRTRPEHRAWHGTIKPVDDPWWDTHNPPCGWNCRCTVEQLTARQAEAQGGETEKPPAFPARAYENPRTGEVTRVEGGIDPGWNYNVGKAHLANVAPKASWRQVMDAPMARPPGLPAIAPRPGPRLLAEDVTRAEAERALLDSFGAGRGGIEMDPGRHPLVIGPELFARSGGEAAAMPADKLRQLPLLAEALLRPAEIWWTWRIAEDASVRLSRRYIAKVAVAGEEIGVAADMTSGAGASWTFRTTLDQGFDLDQARAGVLAWRQVPPSADELAALTSDTASGHLKIKHRLRLGRDAGDMTHAEIAALDTLLRRQVLRRDTLLWRGVHGEEAAEWLDGGMVPGRVLTDRGFLSTSTDREAAEAFAQDELGFLILFRARAGAFAMDVQRLSDAGT
ncbi:MAG: phage minor head protein, partial [Caulobacteraceae bacterium]